MAINKEVKQDIDALREEQGDTSTVSYLMDNFKWWQPVYTPRGEPKDPDAAEKAAITRGVFNLAGEIKTAIFNKTKRGGRVVRKDEESPVLNQVPQEVPEQFDLNSISEALGGNTKRGNTQMQDYVIQLDEEFEEFTNNLSYVYGGSKGTATSTSSGGSEEYEALKVAVSNAYSVSAKADKATKSDLQDALDGWIDAYEAFASKMPSLRNTIPES